MPLEVAVILGLLLSMLVPDALVCQYQVTLVGGVPFQLTVLLPHVLLLTVGVAGVGGGVWALKSIVATTKRIEINLYSEFMMFICFDDFNYRPFYNHNAEQCRDRGRA